MNPLAQELNEVLLASNPNVFEMLSEVGRQLFFPKGILTQSAEAKEKAHRFNATIGMAMEGKRLMHLNSVMELLPGFSPEEALAYAPSYGILPLRMAWMEEIYAKNPSLNGKAISLPVVTQAITHGLAVVGDMWIDPGDTIALTDKLWGNYNMIFGVRRKAKIVTFPLFSKDMGFDTKGLRECLWKVASERNKVILLLNVPNNPTGYTPTEAEAKEIVQVLLELADSGKNVLVLCDDAYFGLVYEEGILKESIFAFLCGLHPRILAIKLDAATKENYVWGLRVGFVTYGAMAQGEIKAMYDALEKKTAGCVRGSISNASQLSQQIILKSMRSPSYLREKQEKYQIMKARAAKIKELLSTGKYADAFEAYPFNSGYFMCIRVKGVNAETARVHLLDNYGVGVISLGDTDLRIAFSCVDERDIEELFEIIYKGIKELKDK